jgi:hypothetical protein
LHSAAYSMCDHDSPERGGQGRSVEWFPPAEDPRRREPATCLAEGGATPGWLGPLPESGDPRWRDDAGSRWGRTESHWFLDWLGHAPTDARAPDAWQPPCVWSETRHRGRTLWTTPVQHDELGHALAPTHVTHADWSCPPEALPATQRLSNWSSIPFVEGGRTRCCGLPRPSHLPPITCRLRMASLGGSRRAAPPVSQPAPPGWTRTSPALRLRFPPCMATGS